MRLTAILLLACSLQLSAKVGAQITLNEKQASLEKVLKIIKAQSGLALVYQDQLLNKAKPVDITVNNVSVKTALDIVFANQILTYEIVGGKIITVKEKSNNDATDDGYTPPPPITVKGRVIDENGNPVRATVIVKSKGRGTVTDDKGEFTLTNIDADAVLIVNSVTIDRSYEVSVNGRTDITVNVKLKVVDLDSFAVKINNGYQTINKERFIGSVTTVDSSLFHREVGTDVFSRLNGITLGVRPKIPNITGPHVISAIRGESTLTSDIQYPLVIVDNFPYEGDYRNLNPNDVENITVLSDAVAASVWGARAANGVIVITTKKAKYNKPLNIKFSSNITVDDKPNLFHYPTMTTSDFIDIEQFLFSQGKYDISLSSNQYPNVSPVVEILNKERSGQISHFEARSQIDALRNLDVRNDFEKYIYRSAVSLQNYLGFNGGANQFGFNFSIGYDHNLGNERNKTGYDRYSLTSGLTFKPSKSVDLGANVSFSSGTDHYGQDLFYPFNTNGGNLYPYAQLADALGNHLAVPNKYRVAFIDTAGGGKLLDWRYIPLDELAADKGFSKNLSGILNLNGSVRISRSLNAGFQYRYQLQSTKARSINDINSFYTRDAINTFYNPYGTTVSTMHPIPIGGIVDVSGSELQTQYFRGQINFNKSWGSKHSIVAMVAGELSESGTSSNSYRVYGYNGDLLTSNTFMDFVNFYPLYLGGTNRIGDTKLFNETVNRFVSVVSNATYAYKNRYSFYASARKDATNLFGLNTNDKWKPLWSAGAGWNIYKEKFYKINWMSRFVLRASYGYSGNVNNSVPAVTTIRYLGPSSATSTLTAGILNPPNPDLRWEEARILNLGLDFTIFKNRISGKVEAFEKNSKDIIAATPIDPTLGIGNTTKKNVANLRARGFDFALSTTNLPAGPIQWNTTLNLSYVKTIAVKNYTAIAKGIPSFGAALEGSDFYGLYSFHWAGLDPLTGDPVGIINGHTSKDYQALTQDSIQNLAYHGSGVPHYFGNMLNNFSWKGLSFSFNIVYRFDYYFRKNVLSYTDLFNSYSTHPDYLRRWQKPGDELYTNIPSLVYPVVAYRDQFYANSEVNVLRGDNIKITDARLSYDINRLKLRKYSDCSIQLFLYASNLNITIWKANKAGIDPDFSANSGIAPIKKWSAGINVGF